MNRLLAGILDKPRAVLSVLMLILVAGAISYRDIPKEAEPDVQLPMIYISMTHEGISPEDAERLLIRPMETELQSLAGVKEMRATASEGHASIIVEFQGDVAIDPAMQDVRDKVDQAKPDLPDETEEPIVQEINLSLFPVLVVTLSGDVAEPVLIRLARELEDGIEAIPDVLEVEIAGEREDLLELVLDPTAIESYGLQAEDLFDRVQRNNQLVAAGALNTEQGRFAVKVPGVFETADDLLSLPLKVDGSGIVTVSDVATVRRTFKDPEGYARVDGRPAVAIEVSKRVGANIIETIEQVRAVVEAERASWPEAVEVAYSQDKSREIAMMLGDLENNVLSAVILVMIVIVAALGARSAGLVGLAVPGSFLAGILVLASAGMTINIVALFGLILSTGMLVDGAIIVVELADRKMAEGMPPRQAYLAASQRMAWPVVSSTLTTITAFLPLMFWPGVVGQFMVYLPLVVIATLTSSLLMALVFVPTLGGVIGRSNAHDRRLARRMAAAETGDLGELRGASGLYVRLMDRLLNHPGKVVAAVLGVTVLTYAAYGQWGRGVEFFPAVDPEVAQVLVHARGDLSVEQRDAILREVEDRIAGVDGVELAYARSNLSFEEDDLDEDVIGRILLEFTDWTTRRPGVAILDEMRARTADMAGVRIEVREEEAGPPVGKPIQLELSSRQPERLDAEVERLRRHMDGMAGLRDVSDTRPAPGIEWQVQVDRTLAARFGADITAVGTAVQLVTNGVLLDTYRPDDADDEVDVRARYPEDWRSLDQLDRLRVQTDMGLVPISTFVQRVPAPRVGSLERVDGERVLEVSADVMPGILASDQLRDLQSWLADQDIDPAVTIAFKGEDEEQREAADFLTKAFGAALFLITITLIIQFNSFYQTAMVLSAIVFSTVGVFLGLLLTGQAFGIVMSGVGVIALAGIVINNNIVLIDTYNDLRSGGMDAREAVLRTGAQRLRPVFLTTFTTVLGLLPMVTRVNVDLIHRNVTHGGPSTDWWSQLATAIAGGLTFATLLTLVLTPCLLWLGASLSAWRREQRGRTSAGHERDGRSAMPSPAE
ncbi:efflux RND transporter permease subunit [Marinivivus vitaminiproducens]|uniref:efflux RND transporter permease subunit n=1 Tax=Marinivivus vitaminiproducens TaxID=3035935 RepID=UPI0027A812EA|nr:efflux RND transporter permease subunit [Geminicoccaceae bacterium SCSIO 64248]